MTDHTLREAGTLVAHLRRAMLDGSRDLGTVPGLLRRIITDRMWNEWVEESGRKMPPGGPFRSFHEFVVTPADRGGLGASVELIRRIVADDKPLVITLEGLLQNPVGVHTNVDVDDVDNVNVRPSGNAEATAIRRLRKDRPDLLAQVESGELKAHAAMVQAGFRPKTITIPVARPEAAAAALCRHMSVEDRRLLASCLFPDDPS